MTEERFSLLSFDLTLHCLFELVGVNQMQYSSSRGSHVPMRRSGRGPTGLNCHSALLWYLSGTRITIDAASFCVAFFVHGIASSFYKCETIVIMASNMLCSNNK